jgi:predicted transcriptional regulator
LKQYAAEIVVVFESRETHREAMVSLLLSSLQIQQIQAGICEADAGDFASDDEVAAVLAKWTKPRFR